MNDQWVMTSGGFDKNNKINTVIVADNFNAMLEAVEVLENEFAKHKHDVWYPMWFRIRCVRGLLLKSLAFWNSIVSEKETS